MKNAILVSVFLILALVSGCGGEIRKISRKEYLAPASAICVDVGTTYVATHGGTCSGIVETIPERYVFHYEDGSSEIVAKSTYDAYAVGDER